MLLDPRRDEDPAISEPEHWLEQVIAIVANDLVTPPPSVIGLHTPISIFRDITDDRRVNKKGQTNIVCR